MLIINYFLTRLPPKYNPIIADIRWVSNGVITTPKNSLSIVISFCSTKNKNPLENSVQVKYTLVSKNTGANLGQAIIKNVIS